MKKQNGRQKIEILKYSGLFLLLVLSVALLLSSCLFYAHISLTKAHILSSFFLSGILFFLFFKKEKKRKDLFWKSVGLGVLVFAISLLSMSFIYDRSSDGNTYHKDAIGNLYLGWNPVYESSESFVAKHLQTEKIDMDQYDIWKDHYAKANWILEANLYQLTDHIESGKAVNVILMYILFALTVAYFYSILGVKAFLLALVVTFNPIACNQVFTFYNDQLGASLFFILLLALLQIVAHQEKTSTLEKYGTLFLVFPIILNIKFNIMGYAMIFTCFLMLYYLFVQYQEKRFFQTFKKLVLYYLVLFVMSFGVIGYPTYIKNFIDHQNFFYPIYGEGKEDIITAQQPKDFGKKNTLQKFLIATFAKTNNLQTQKNYTLKIPFTVSLEEWKESMSVDTRLSGYGVFFSGLFLVSIVILALYFFRSKQRQEKRILLLLSALTIGIILLIQESWWARYNPTTYLFLLAAFYLVLRYGKNKCFKGLFTLLIACNAGVIFLGNAYYSLSQSIQIQKTFQALQGKEVLLSTSQPPVAGILYNLKDAKIHYQFTKQPPTQETYYHYLHYEVKDENK